MSGAVVIPPGGGEVVGDSPDRRVEILSDHESLHATWSRFGPGREGADLHVHLAHTDLFYVLDGELTLRLGLEDEQVAAAAGTLIRVPPHVVHGFRNAGEAEVRYLNLHAPGRGFADYMRARRDGREFSYDQFDPPADGGLPVTEAAIDVVERVEERPGLRRAVLADIEAIAIAEVTAAAPTETTGGGIDFFYVLEGELTVTADQREVGARAGSWVNLRHNAPARLTPAGSRARYLHLRPPA